MGQGVPTQGMPWGWGQSFSGDWWGAGKAAFQGKKQRDADVCVRNGAGHEVTPTFQRWEGVNQGIRGVHREKKLPRLSQALVGPASVGD